MVRNRRALYGALAGLALALAAYTLSRDDRAAAVSLSLPGLQRTSRTATADTELPRIGLDRLQRPHGGVEVGKRDIFDFGPPPPTPPPPPPPPTPVPTPGAQADLSPPPPSLPPMTVKYIGSLADNQRGLKVAVLLNDRKEVLTGGVGEVVGNRFRIVSIGLESVDVQDLGNNRVQRIPLRGN
jgi:hypothetical protein